MRRAIFPVMLAASLLVGCQHFKSDDSKGDEPKKEDISFDKLPANVQSKFLAAHPGVTVKEVEKETYPDGTVHYEVEFLDSAGKEIDVELNADGDVLDDH